MIQPPAIDLWQDIARGCRFDLTSRGHSVDGLDDWHSVWTLLNAERRGIPTQSRKVFCSRQFQCPSAHLQALSDIEAKIRKGEDLNPHLSKLTENATDHDPLLNHWGIYHLHLGTKLRRDGFIERTNHLLFCRFTAESAYLIDVHPHKDAWPRSEMMKIVHDNWPETIARWRARGVSGQLLSDSEIRNLRGNGVNHVLRMADGTAYFPPGGGTSASGSNIIDTLVTDCLRHWATNESQRIIGNWTKIAEDVRNEGVAIVEPVNLELWFNGTEYRALEATQRFDINLNQPDAHCSSVAADQIARIKANHV